MSYLHRQWLLIMRKSYHSACLFALAFFFSLFGLVGTYFSHIVTSYQELVIQDVGYVLTLYRSDDQDIAPEIREEIASIPGVSGVNMESHQLVAPVGFENIVSGEGDSAFDRQQEEQVKLVANLNIDQNIVFQNYCQLISGVLPDETHPGVLICRDLADQNRLSTGDSISLSWADEEAVSLSVVGIYTTTSPIQESLSSASGYESYGNSPYSYLFCDLSSYQLVTGFTVDDGIDIYTSSRDDLDSVFQQLSDMGYADPPYSLSNITKDMMNITVTAQSVTRMAQVITGVSTVMTVISVFLLMFLWMRNNYKDAAILISLGKSRSLIVLDYYVLITVVICAALLLTNPLFALFTECHGSDIIQYAMSMFLDNNGSESEAMIQTAMAKLLSFQDYICSNMIFLGISWISTALASIEIFRCNPRVLFLSE